MTASSNENSIDMLQKIFEMQTDLNNYVFSKNNLQYLNTFLSRKKNNN